MARPEAAEPRDPTIPDDELDLELRGYSQAARATREVRRGRAGDWALYTAAGGAALALAPSADAAVVYSGVQNIQVTPAQGSQNVDLDGDGLVDVGLQPISNGNSHGFMLQGLYAARFAGTPAPGYNTGMSPWVGRFQYSNVAPTTGDTLLFGAGAVGIQQGASFEGNWPGGNPTATSGYAVMSFYTTGGGPHFGWLRLAVHNGANGLPDQLTLVDWAYESDTNTPLHVPEPSGLAMLAAGAAGVAALRRRRSAQA